MRSNNGLRYRRAPCGAHLWEVPGGHSRRRETRAGYWLSRVFLPYHVLLVGWVPLPKATAPIRTWATGGVPLLSLTPESCLLIPWRCPVMVSEWIICLLPRSSLNQDSLWKWQLLFSTTTMSPSFSLLFPHNHYGPQMQEHQSPYNSPALHTQVSSLGRESIWDTCNGFIVNYRIGNNTKLKKHPLSWLTELVFLNLTV